MQMLKAIPALPVAEMPRSIAFCRDKLGFALVHHDGGFAIVQRDAVTLHQIWVPWGMREDPEGGQLAAAAAREQLRGHFPRGAIALGPGELRCDHPTALASWRFAFTVIRMRLVARSER